MFKDTHAFSGFSVNDLAAATAFYGEVLGVTTSESPMGLTLQLAVGTDVFVYPKSDHVPATFTILNFVVADIDQAVDQLVAQGIVFEQYAGLTDEKGIARGITVQRGPDIAWFKDPAGNILSVLKNA